MNLTRHIKQLKQIKNRLKSQEVIYRAAALQSSDAELKNIFKQISNKRREMRFELLQSIHFSNLEHKMRLNRWSTPSYQLDISKRNLLSDNNETVIKAIEKETELLLHDYSAAIALSNGVVIIQDLLNEQTKTIEGELYLFNEFA